MPNIKCLSLETCNNNIEFTKSNASDPQLIATFIWPHYSHGFITVQSMDVLRFIPRPDHLPLQLGFLYCVQQYGSETNSNCVSESAVYCNCNIQAKQCCDIPRRVGRPAVRTRTYVFAYAPRAVTRSLPRNRCAAISALVAAPVPPRYG